MTRIIWDEAELDAALTAIERARSGRPFASPRDVVMAMRPMLLVPEPTDELFEPPHAA